MLRPAHSPSTAAPNSPTGHISRPGLAYRPGSATHSRPGRKARWRTPTDAPENGYRETPIRCRSRTAIFIRSAPISTRHRANASASKRRQKCSSRSCWRQADEATTLPWLPVALQLELTSGGLSQRRLFAEIPATLYRGFRELTAYLELYSAACA